MYVCVLNRIRQLNWVSGKNLECRIHETSSEVRELVYTSITGLLYYYDINYYKFM